MNSVGKLHKADVIFLACSRLLHRKTNDLWLHLQRFGVNIYNETESEHFQIQLYEHFSGENS
jgi:hypothetical protein